MCENNSPKITCQFFIEQQAGGTVFDSGPVAPDHVYRLPEFLPGRYAYHCDLHPLMRGVLLIIE